MRIAFIIYGSIDTITGGYIYNKILFEYLNAHHIEVKIFSQPHGSIFSLLKNNFSHALFSELITFAPDIILQDEMNFISLFWFNYWFRYKLKKNEHKFGKLNQNFNISIISIVHMLNARNLILNNGNYFALIKKYLLKKLEYFYLRSVDGFIFNSSATQNAVLELIKQNPPFIIAYPGKDRLNVQISENHIANKCREKNLLIAFIGNLLYGKGLHVLLQALHRIQNRFWQLSIIGDQQFDPIYTRKIIKMIEQLKLEENIRWLGRLERDRLSQVITSYHVLAVPSYYESYGMVYAEAMGAGMPIIACNQGGAPEIVTDQINGFLIEPDDAAKLGNHLETLMHNREMLKSMSLSSLAAYQSIPSWEESMKKIREFLTSFV